ncbi:S-type pyocin domain-containing protein [Enterobacter ludwigii]|uniref:S-type pyocin domain-containing protein n=1 Tax=Enterobacter ludwigii TaxID=299767 RepID=UPI003BEEDC57
MGYRTDCYGRGQGLDGDITTTGARCIASSTDTDMGRRLLRVGDITTRCPKCGKPGEIITGEPRDSNMGKDAAVDGSEVRCGCPPGKNRVIAPLGQWLGQGPSPSEVAQAQYAATQAAKKAEEAETRDRSRVFAKSRHRGEGCNDAGDQSEPHNNFASMGLYRAAPAVTAATDSDAPQHAQTAKKKPPAPDDIPKPKKRSALYKWMFGNEEEQNYQAAVAVAASAARAAETTEGASILEQVAGRFGTYGTWAVRSAPELGEVMAGGVGAPVAGLLLGMMPGKLNDGEQDFIDRSRLLNMREAPSRVRFTWDNDSRGNAVPHGWHTPPGKDMVRVRKMEWDIRYKAYSFTTEEAPCITIIWTPDKSGVNTPLNTGNQTPVALPDTVIVDPLPDNTSITTTTSPAPEEKTFADYILILPMDDIPPIYVYIRNNPGQVTGKGQKVSGIWLSDADKGNGSPVPSQIADKLRGRTFTNFDRFREAFWLEVSRDPELSQQFIQGNIARMKNGMAPRARFVDHAGKRHSFEIHHIKPISLGGEVYNVDNMGVTTPKRHIDIHRGP